MGALIGINIFGSLARHRNREFYLESIFDKVFGKLSHRLSDAGYLNLKGDDLKLGLNFDYNLTVHAEPNRLADAINKDRELKAEVISEY